ncbi:MAG: hypothetical protein QNK36_14705 [Colwellia sp.]|nr:hypothetical protein [Colwellia sp.]
MKIQHHGAVNGVTGSCHQIHIDKHNSILIESGLFQDLEQSKEPVREQGTEKHNGDHIQGELLSIIKTSELFVV